MAVIPAPARSPGGPATDRASGATGPAERDGAFIWQPSLAVGQPATLLGYPVVEAEDMPDIAAGSLSIAFGNFQAGYVISERSETSILRDPFSNKPFVHFYAVKRSGGAVANSEAIKLMKFAAS